MTLSCYKPSCFSYVSDHVHGLVSMKIPRFAYESRKVCNRTKPPPASILFKGKGTEHTTVKWSFVPKVGSAIHWINCYPLDNAIGFRNTYPLDSDLSGG